MPGSSRARAWRRLSSAVDTLFCWELIRLVGLDILRPQRVLPDIEFHLAAGVFDVEFHLADAGVGLLAPALRVRRWSQIFQEPGGPTMAPLSESRSSKRLLRKSYPPKRES